jgi:hypothetical protein
MEGRGRGELDRGNPLQPYRCAHARSNVRLSGLAYTARMNNGRSLSPHRHATSCHRLSASCRRRRDPTIMMDTALGNLTSKFGSTMGPEDPPLCFTSPNLGAWRARAKRTWMYDALLHFTFNEQFK